MTVAMTQSRSAVRFTLRPTTLDDMTGALALANMCSQETLGRDEFDMEDYRNSWSDPAYDLAADTRKGAFKKFAN